MTNVSYENFSNKANPTLSWVLVVEVFCHQFTDLDECDILMLVELSQFLRDLVLELKIHVTVLNGDSVEFVEVFLPVFHHF